MKMRRWTILITLLGLAGTDRAWAFRPADFSDADVAESRTIEFEIAPAEYLKQGQFRALNVPNLAINFGIGRGFEFGVEAINLVALEPEEGEPNAQIVDAGLAIKKLIRRGSLQDARGPSVALETVVLFPGREAIHLGIEGSGIVSATSNRGAVHLEAAVARSTEGVSEAATGIILESSDYHGWRPVLQLGVSGAHEEAPQRNVIVGMIYEPHDGLAFDLGVNVGRSEGDDSREIRSGVTWQIGPRTTAPARHWIRRHLRGHHH